MAQAWFREEYEPVVEMLREAGLARKGTETEAYMRVVPPALPAPAHARLERQVIERLREELERPSWDEDTMVKRLRKELR